MEKFKVLKKIGDGSFGVVIQAQDQTTDEMVAIKKMKQKYPTWEECINLRELKALQKLKHINIVRLKEVIRVHDELSFVFEFVDKSLYQLYTASKELNTTLPENQVRSIIYQAANALAYMHKHGFFHRDLKPENMLFGSDGVLKIIDFGLAREIRSRPPFTDYVATRWYRAPEILLQQPNYNSPVDIFALGCIMCELYLNRSIFQGTSEMDQLNKILSILGTFTQTEWPEGHRLLTMKGITVAQFPAVPLNTVIPNASPDALNLIQSMLKWDPNKRIKASQILQHPFFNNPHTFLPQAVLDATAPESRHQLVRPNKLNGNFPEQMTQQQQQQQQQPQQQQWQQQQQCIFPPTHLTAEKQAPPAFQDQKQTKPQNTFELHHQPNYTSSKQFVRVQLIFQRLKQQQSSEEFERMLDLINGKDNSTKGPKKPPQIPGGLDLLSYKSVPKDVNIIRGKRNSTNDSMDAERNNSVSGEQSKPFPFPLQKKYQNSGSSGQGLSVPPLGKPEMLSKPTYTHSIYNFDHVKIMPDQNFRMNHKQS